jgi:hypothetical protein
LHWIHAINRRGMKPAKHRRVRTYLMKFKIEVGEVEKHLVEFSYNQLAGSVLIKVDKETICSSARLLNEPVTEIYQFVVGRMERSEVRIEKIRRQLFGHRNCVYVDGRLRRIFEGIG